MLPTQREVIHHHHHPYRHHYHLHHQVIEMMIWVLAKREGKVLVSLAEAVRAVGEKLMDHWIWSNVYTVKLQNIQNQIKKLYLEFRKLSNWSKERQTENWKKTHLTPFLEKIQMGMDISTLDANSLKKMEEKYGVKMTEEDRLYKDDQMSGPRKMYCQTFADQHWLITTERRRHEEERLAMNREKDTSEQARLFSKVAVPSDVEDIEQEEYVEGDDKDEEPMEETTEEDAGERKRKRRKSGEKEHMARSSGDLPKNWQHIRHSVKNVRAEYNLVVDDLISLYHMSYEQAISAVVTVGRRMFDLDWKKFEEGDEITIDTVPDKKMNRKMGKALEAFTLSEVVNLMLDQEESTTVTYHDDGSRSKGAGGYFSPGSDREGQVLPSADFGYLI